METELKLMLPSRRAMEALLARVGVAHKRGVRQTNYFYDTAAGHLLAEKYHLRLRRNEDLDGIPGDADYVVTIKGPKQHGIGAGASAMSARPEEEVPVGAAVVDNMRDAHALLDAFGRQPAALVQSVRQLASGHALVPKGRFENIRVSAPHPLPLTGGAHIDVTLEIDATRFEHRGQSTEEYECEVELPPARADEAGFAAAAETSLRALLRDACGVTPMDDGRPFTFPPAKGKRSRHAAFIKRVDKQMRKGQL